MNDIGTILLAEDDDTDSFLFETALRKAGVRNSIARVANGEEALEYLTGTGRYADRDQYPFPCLLVTDLKMPRLSGLDLLERAAALLKSAQLPAIVLSASVSETDRSRSFELGAHRYYVKPPALRELIAIATELKETWLAPITKRP